MKTWFSSPPSPRVFVYLFAATLLLRSHLYLCSAPPVAKALVLQWPLFKNCRQWIFLSLTASRLCRKSAKWLTANSLTASFHDSKVKTAQPVREPNLGVKAQQWFCGWDSDRGTQEKSWALFCFVLFPLGVVRSFDSTIWLLFNKDERVGHKLSFAENSNKIHVLHLAHILVLHSQTHATIRSSPSVCVYVVSA